MERIGRAGRGEEARVDEVSERKGGRYLVGCSNEIRHQITNAGHDAHLHADVIEIDTQTGYEPNVSWLWKL